MKNYSLFLFGVATLAAAAMMTSCSDKFTVEFDSNGGNSIAGQTVNSGELIIAPPPPKLEGSNFIGWYRDNNTFMSRWMFANDVVTSDVTLWAKWDNISGPVVCYDCGKSPCECPDVGEGTLGLAFFPLSEGQYEVAVGSAKGDVVIPSVYENRPVTQIKDNGFLEAAGLTSITIPRTVKTIGFRAFLNCTALTSVVFAPGCQLNEIGTSSFYGCTGLRNFTIPRSVRVIKEGAFFYCTFITSITIPNGVTSLNPAFWGWVDTQTIRIQTHTIAPPGWSTGFGADNNCNATIVWGVE